MLGFWSKLLRGFIKREWVDGGVMPYIAYQFEVFKTF